MIDINDDPNGGRMFNTNINSINKKKNFKNEIKIEKKIRLNYNRPQDLNSILNFGTLC